MSEKLNEDALTALKIAFCYMPKTIDVNRYDHGENFEKVLADITTVREKRGITGDTALRLAQYFGGDAQSWLNLQSIYELRMAEINAGERIRQEVQPMHHAA